VGVEAAGLLRAFDGRGRSYSRFRMEARDESPSRETSLEKVRTRILAAARRSLSSADAEDLAQEVMVVLHERYAHVEAPQELVALGVTILRLKRMAAWRKARRRQDAGHTVLPSLPGEADDPVEATPDAGAPDPEAIAHHRERLRLFTEAAGRLDGRCREILRLKLEGLSFVEIARRLGRPVNTVYSWDWRCHQRLKRMLGAHWGFVSGEEGR
jgi:RNA polymerase sigma-70 factor (ECF subfamily)